MNLEEESKIYEFIKIFIQQDFYNAVYFCSTWNGTNEKYFREKDPEDFVIYILERILEGKRKVFLVSYKTFKGSVYFHLKNEMLTYFNCRKKSVEEESPHYIRVNDSNEIAYDDDIYYEDNHNFYESEITNYIEMEELRNQIINLFDPDNDVEELLVLNGYTEGKKREEIAKDLGITVKEVTNIKKRIIRKVKKIGIKT